MIGAEHSRLEALSARLAANAYDAPALFERLVLLCAARDSKSARALFERIRPFLGPSRGTAALDDLVSGKVEIRYAPPCYWLGPAPAVDQLVQMAADLAGEVGDVLRIEAPVLVLNLHANARAPIHSIRLVNGFGMIVTADTHITGPQGKGLLAHEIVHCALACGQLLLDEGLATYFQRRHGPEPEQPLDTRGLPSLRALLQREAELLLRGSSDPHYVQQVYDYGALLVRWILTTRTAESLASFMQNAVLSLSRGTLAPDLERHFEVSLEDLERTLRGVEHGARGPF